MTSRNPPMSENRKTRTWPITILVIMRDWKGAPEISTRRKLGSEAGMQLIDIEVRDVWSFWTEVQPEKIRSLFQGQDGEGETSFLLPITPPTKHTTIE
jgi:hypothetical protein